jgi:hypothetical protein
MHVRIFNYSNVRIDRELWHWLAGQLGLDGIIRDADLLDRKELSVVVKTRPSWERDADAMHGFCRIDVWPCRKCNSGFVLMGFLHELFHEWLYVRHEVWTSTWDERFCALAAFHVFYSLGGRVYPTGLACTTYRIRTQRRDKEGRKAVAGLLASLDRCKEEELLPFFKRLPKSQRIPREWLKKVPRVKGKRWLKAETERVEKILEGMEKITV